MCKSWGGGTCQGFRVVAAEGWKHPPKLVAFYLVLYCKVEEGCVHLAPDFSPQLTWLENKYY